MAYDVNDHKILREMRSLLKDRICIVILLTPYLLLKHKRNFNMIFESLDDKLFLSVSISASSDKSW